MREHVFVGWVSWRYALAKVGLGQNATIAELCAFFFQVMVFRFRSRFIGWDFFAKRPRQAPRTQRWIDGWNFFWDPENLAASGNTWKWMVRSVRGSRSGTWKKWWVNLSRSHVLSSSQTADRGPLNQVYLEDDPTVSDCCSMVTEDLYRVSLTISLRVGKFVLTNHLVIARHCVRASQSLMRSVESFEKHQSSRNTRCCCLDATIFEVMKHPTSWKNWSVVLTTRAVKSVSHITPVFFQRVLIPIWAWHFVRGLMIVFMRIGWFLTPKECFKDHLFTRAYIVHASRKRCNFIDRAKGTSEAVINGQALVPLQPLKSTFFALPFIPFTVEPPRLSQPMSCLQGYFAIYVLGRLFGPPNPNSSTEKTYYFPGLESGKIAGCDNYIDYIDQQRQIRNDSTI